MKTDGAFAHRENRGKRRPLITAVTYLPTVDLAKMISKRVQPERDLPAERAIMHASTPPARSMPTAAGPCMMTHVHLQAVCARAPGLARGVDPALPPTTG
jgi:hypothetical protein